MCDTCGCGEIPRYKHGHNHGHKHDHEASQIHDHDHDDGHSHDHSHDHDHDHKSSHSHNHRHHDHNHDHTDDRDYDLSKSLGHDQSDDAGLIIPVGKDILDINNRLAERNRGFFEARNILVVNMMSSPGSGKTTLLERTLKEMKKMRFYVIEGDQQTSNDADRIAATGVPVVQVNTGRGCHLDATMVSRAVKELNPDPDSVLIIENVGNLICPAMFDLGEEIRIVLMSVTEGDDKPLKYPDMFRSSSLCIINKTDLLPYVDFNVSRAIENGLHVNGRLSFIEVSAKTGEGMEEWYTWLSAYSG
jgi:hydrogenase nickel incorporation protein HypB